MPNDREQLLAELAAVHRQMLERDAVFAHCEEEIQRRDEHLAAKERDLADTQSELAAAGAHIEDLTQQIEQMRATRAWRLAVAVWTVRARVGRAVRRR